MDDEIIKELKLLARITLFLVVLMIVVIFMSGATPGTPAIVMLGVVLGWSAGVALTANKTGGFIGAGIMGAVFYLAERIWG